MAEYKDFLNDFATRTKANLAALAAENGPTAEPVVADVKQSYTTTAELSALICLFALFRQFEDALAAQHKPEHAQFLGIVSRSLVPHEEIALPAPSGRIDGIKNALVHFDFQTYVLEGQIGGIVLISRTDALLPPKWKARLERSDFTPTIDALVSLFAHPKSCLACP